MIDKTTAANAPANAPLLEIRDLKKHFPITKGLFSSVHGYVKAVDGVSFAIPSADRCSAWSAKAVAAKRRSAG